MSAKQKMTELQIAAKIKAGKPFTVPAERERKMALSAAKYLGIGIFTKANYHEGFNIFFTRL